MFSVSNCRGPVQLCESGGANWDSSYNSLHFSNIGIWTWLAEQESWSNTLKIKQEQAEEIGNRQKGAFWVAKEMKLAVLGCTDSDDYHYTVGVGVWC